MAIGKSGINGPFSGKVGSVIGYELGGQMIIRSVGRRTKPFSKQELLNQAKMKVVSLYLQPLKPMIQFGFKGIAPKGSRIGAFQMAQSHARKFAVELDEDGRPFVEPSKVLLSKGELPPPENCRILREGNMLRMACQTPSTINQGVKLMVILYDGVNDAGFQEIEFSKGTENYEWEWEMIGADTAQLHAYILFLLPFSLDVSNSVYCRVET